MEEQGKAMTWDVNGMLASVTVPAGSSTGVAGTHTYQYDVLGRRVRKVTTGAGASDTVYIHEGSRVMCEYTYGELYSNPLRTYVYGTYVDEPVMLVDRTAAGAVGAGTDERFYYHRNQQYSVTALTDSAGTVTERYAYTAYGEPKILDGDGTTTRRNVAKGCSATSTTCTVAYQDLPSHPKTIGRRSQMDVFEINTTSEMCGDYGRILLQGILSHFPCDESVCIDRTGPYIPDAVVMNGQLLLPERELPSFMNKWGASVVVNEVQVTKLVRFDFTLDELPRIADRIRGEPENIIVEGQHDEGLLQSMGEIYSVAPIESVKYTSFKYNRSTRRIEVLGGCDINEPLYQARFAGGSRLYCSEEFREWVLQKSTWAPFLRFIPVDFLNVGE